MYILPLAFLTLQWSSRVVYFVTPYAEKLSVSFPVVPRGILKLVKVDSFSRPDVPDTISGLGNAEEDLREQSSSNKGPGFLVLSHLGFLMQGTRSGQKPRSAKTRLTCNLNGSTARVSWSPSRTRRYRRIFGREWQLINRLAHAVCSRAFLHQPWRLWEAEA